VVEQHAGTAGFFGDAVGDETHKGARLVLVVLVAEKEIGPGIEDGEPGAEPLDLLQQLKKERSQMGDPVAIEDHQAVARIGPARRGAHVAEKSQPQCRLMFAWRIWMSASRSSQSTRNVLIACASSIPNHGTPRAAASYRRILVMA
jgi:hypothetical protein